MNSGFNPIRRTCETHGCWNDAHRFKIELLAECLYRPCAFSDIDASAEQYGHFLFLDFKGHTGEIPTGQRIYHERLTKLSSKITTFFVHADPPSSTCYAMRVMHNGIMEDWESCSLDQLKGKIKEWKEKAGLSFQRELRDREASDHEFREWANR